MQFYTWGRIVRQDGEGKIKIQYTYLYIGLHLYVNCTQHMHAYICTVYILNKIALHTTIGLMYIFVYSKYCYLIHDLLFLPISTIESRVS